MINIKLSEILKDLKKDGKWYDPVFYKEQVINKQWAPKYPIFRMAERDNTPIISKEFKTGKI